MNKFVREAKLWLVAIPVLLWTLLPIYHIFLFSISTKDSAFSGALWPDHPTLRNLGLEAGLRPAAVGAGRGRAHRRRDAAAAFPPRLSAPDDALARRHRHLCAVAGVERVPIRFSALVAREHHPARGGPRPFP